MHFENDARNATYRSKNIQNELIKISAELLRNEIVKEITRAKFFSIMADEAADVSVKEQLSLVIRFVDDKSNIREEFLEFIHCKDGTSGKAISDVILHQLVQLGIDIKNCRGQGYDGAGNMSGKNKGVIKNIQDWCGKALGCHCQAHLLNLGVVSACKINPVVVMMNKLRCVQEFFDFPKRLSLLSGMIDECDLPHIKNENVVGLLSHQVGATSRFVQGDM